jgi:hypothetical protein
MLILYEHDLIDLLLIHESFCDIGILNFLIDRPELNKVLKSSGTC